MELTADTRGPVALVVVGTRPEAVKLGPVVRALKARTRITTVLCVTGQHREMLDQTLRVFDLVPDQDLDLMQTRQPLDGIAASALLALGGVMDELQPTLVVVEGDTTTVFVAALAAFYRRIPVAHVEAGLRTHTRYAPFPEEMLRRLISQLTTLHFAPTEHAAENLRREHLLPDAEIHVTGNPVVDAVRWVASSIARKPTGYVSGGSRMLLVTAHRRENLGPALERICEALLRIADRHDGVELVYPVHRNPEVRTTVERVLGGHPRVRLLPPQDYVDFVHLMSDSYLILTDSGGIQEEAPVLGKPVLVMREGTERPEAVEQGTAALVGTDPERIVAAVERLLTDPIAYAAASRPSSPFGDGHSAERIAGIVEQRILAQPREDASSSSSA